MFTIVKVLHYHVFRRSSRECDLDCLEGCWNKEVNKNIIQLRALTVRNDYYAEACVEAYMISKCNTTVRK
jgi:hypothetical protein